MDARLFRIGGKRLEALTDADLPNLARAIVASLRGLAKASRGLVRDTPYVRIQGMGLDALVRGDDWDLITPFITDGSWDPSKFPPPKVFPYHIETEYDVAVIDTNDAPLYQRVLADLGAKFTRKFPRPLI